MNKDLPIVASIGVCSFFLGVAIMGKYDDTSTNCVHVATACAAYLCVRVIFMWYNHVKEL
jgi:hypothetical protein